MRLTLIITLALVGITLAAVPSISQTTARLPVPRAGIAIASTDKYVIFWGGLSDTEKPSSYDAADLFDLATGQFITIPQTTNIIDDIFFRSIEVYASVTLGPYAVFTRSGLVALLDTKLTNYSTHDLDWQGVSVGASTESNIILSSGDRFDAFDSSTKSWSILNVTANGTFVSASLVGDDIYFIGYKTNQLITVLNTKTLDLSLIQPPAYDPQASYSDAPYIHKMFFIGDTFYFYTDIGLLYYKRNEDASAFQKLDYSYTFSNDVVHMQLGHMIVSAPRSVHGDVMTVVILDTSEMQWSNVTVPVTEGRVAMAVTAFQERFILIAGGYDRVNASTYEGIVSDKIIILDFSLPASPSASAASMQTFATFVSIVGFFVLVM